MKRISIYLSIMLFVVVGMLTSCEKEPSYEVVKVDTTFRKVFVEVFRGSKSSECAKFDDSLVSLKAKYGDMMVIMSYNAGPEAEPDPANGYADYRTAFGDFLYTQMGINSVPTVLVNGEKVESNKLGGVIQSYTNQIMPIKINTTTCEFVEATGDLVIKGNIKSQYPTTQKLRLQAGIIENGLVSSQNVNGSIDNGYIHNNVFRGELITISDEMIITNGNLSFDETIALDSNIDVENSSVVLYVVAVGSNDVGTNSIVQCAETNITVKTEDEPEEPTTFHKKVLLEEHTGQKCPNCKNGADMADAMMAKYGDQLTVIAIHAGMFAKPSSSGLFSLDLRSDVGDIYYKDFKIPAQPMGIINRKNWEGSGYNCDINSWDNHIKTCLDEELEAGITLKQTYNATTKKLSATVIVHPQIKMTGDYKIIMLVTESGIVGQQQNGSDIINPYTFNHVLRGSMNGAWGTDIITGSAEAGKTISKGFSMTLDPSWVAEKMHIVAVLTKSVSGSTIQEVVQVEEIKVK